MNNSNVKSFQEYLEMDGSIAFNLAIYNRFSSIGDSAYAEICGGFIEGVYQWSDHNINYVDESQNAKYYGYTIHFNGGATRRVYIEQWVLNIQPKNWKHAKSLFNKYLKEDNKYNTSDIAQGQNSYSY
jgi:hypothetical protein